MTYQEISDEMKKLDFEAITKMAILQELDSYGIEEPYREQLMEATYEEYLNHDITNLISLANNVGYCFDNWEEKYDYKAIIKHAVNIMED